MDIRNLSPIPPAPNFDDIESIKKWTEQLKQRLRDADQKVDDDPLDFNWPRPLPYVWPTDKKSFIV